MFVGGDKRNFTAKMKRNRSTSPMGFSQDRRMNAQRRGVPLRSTATPAWNIADEIVKEDVREDKNNDSGVSPGHYTSNSVSPRSRRSSSTANGSLSPGSVTSQDSSAMQYEYSPQGIFKSYGAPVGFSRNRSSKSQSAVYEAEMSQMNRNMETEQPVDLVSRTIKPDSDDSDAVMQCPICPFNTTRRMQFNEHLIAHCAPKGDTTDSAGSSSANAGSLSEDGVRGSPSNGERSEQEFEDADEPGLRVPRVNCQGKVKTFRCKQCNFVAITKLEFWDHSRGHIKAEKLLTCPKCPFVTEYKHHLEYHLRNHFGSKPFKCDKCPYSCVNKSMLNSHLKSHSNIYQYRCAECSYATKYCHSLKLHLRKYAHKPAMVLNPDGSPNPLPIIDVYGTRRGPKQKSTPKTVDDSGPSSTAGSSGGCGETAKIEELPNNLKSNCTGENVLTPIPMNAQFPYNHIFSVGLGAGSFMQNYHPESNNLFDINRRQNIFGFNRETVVSGDYVNTLRAEVASTSSTSDVGNVETYESVEIGNGEVNETEETIPMLPLDLSTRAVVQNTNTNLPRRSGTSRRKGRAFRLDELMAANESDDESTPSEETLGSSSEERQPMVNIAHMLPQISQSNNIDLRFFLPNDDTDYDCHYCHIAFGNLIMYTVHMGYHGYKNPYTCNMCGYQCTDKISFFLHIARDSHT